MSSEQTGPMRAENPFFGPEQKAKWAQLARRGGDRVAILFEELRKRISVIEGLSEELCFISQEEGWAPRYSVGNKMLFAARVRPGSLETELGMHAEERAALLQSRKLAGAMRRALEAAHEEAGEFTIRLALKGEADVRALARLTVLRARVKSKSHD